MLIDVTLPITEDSVFRVGSPPVTIGMASCRDAEGNAYETTTLFMPVHTATHIDLVFTDKTLSVDRMIGSGKLIDATHITGRDITALDLSNRADIHEDDFVFIRTDWTRHLGSEEYHNHPQLSLDAVRWLISRRINIIGIDAMGVGRDGKHSEYDTLFAEKDIYVLENLTNLDAIPAPVFTVYCFPLSIPNVEAVPARVIVQI